MSWVDYLHMSTKQRRKLARDAARGDKDALASLSQYTRDIKKEANKRLAKLERAGADYGNTYNNLAFFLDTQYDSNRLQSPTQLGYDPWAMSQQNEVAAKFLERKSSTLEGMRSIERHRLEGLKNSGALPENLSHRKGKEFLRFLGNEEISAAIDEYGASEVVVEMMYDAYQEGGTNALRVLNTAMTEWLANRITFDDAMERVGVKVENYHRGFPTS